jgi:quinol monooxygenase YgiN
MHVRFAAQPGRGDALAAILLQAAAGVQEEPACRLYVVSRSPDDPDVVFVTEAWTDRAAHDAALQDDGAQALIQQAMPMLAGPPDAVELRPAGGKGL